MKNYSLYVIMITLGPTLASAQSIDLFQCHEDALNNSPLKKQELYYSTQNDLRAQNINTSNLPQVSLNGQFSYQSDIFTIPVQSVDIPDIPKEQYRVTMSVTQKIYDGGTVRNNLSLVRTTNELNQQKVAVSLYQIKEIINQLYFTILQLQQNENTIHAVIAELDNRIKEVTSAITNGVVLLSSKNALIKQQLSAEQQLLEIQLNKMALLNILGEWTEQSLDESTILTIPPINELNKDNNRPELKFFDLQASQLDDQMDLTKNINHPRFFAFADGGLGNPNPLDIFQVDPSFYYVVGLRMQWNLWDWGSRKRDIDILNINKEIIMTDKEDFDQRVQKQLIQQHAEIEKMELLIAKDRQILELQNEIVATASNQLQLGTISSTAYITELNKRTEAEVNLKLHELQLVKAKIDLLTQSGNI